MTALRVEDVFSRSRLQMATSSQVEVFREAAAPGERRRYTKRFLATAEGDFRAWTARESRILAHLRGHGVRCVPELIGLDTGNDVVQTFDAGVTVDHYVTLLPVQTDARVVPHVFADCAHWWALAHHTLRALETLHLFQLVHLDVKADNICVPVLPAAFIPGVPGSTMGMQFARLALIDFAFSLLPAEPLAEPLPIRPQSEYRYQSPRLLKALEAGRAGNLLPMQVLDWRCDIYSLAAMLRLYLPAHRASESVTADGWSDERHSRALALLAALDDAHDRDVGLGHPHQALIEMCEAEMRDPELVASLMQGFALAAADAARLAAAPSTPLTCIETCGLAIESAASAPVSTTTPAVIRKRSHVVVAHRPAAQARGVVSTAAAARGATSKTPAPRSVVPKTAAARGAPRTSQRAMRTTAHAPISAQRSPPLPSLRPSGDLRALTIDSRRDAPPVQQPTRIAAPPPRSPSHILRARPAYAIIAMALVIALGIAIYVGDQLQGGSPTSRNANPDAMGAARMSHVANERVAAAPPSTGIGESDPVRSTPDRSTKGPNGELSVDAATVQRAANADPREASNARARDTDLPEPRDSAPAPKRDAVAKLFPQVPPGVSSASGTRQAELGDNVAAREHEAALKPSRQAPPPVSSQPAIDTQTAPPPAFSRAANDTRTAPPPTSSQPASDTRTEPPVGSPPPLPRRDEMSVARNRPPPPPVAEKSPRAADPEAPAAARSIRPSQPDERTIAMVPASALDNVVARTARDVERVLATAANVEPGNEERIVQVAQSMRPVLGVPHIPTESPPLARRLNAEARAAWERQDIDRALTLQQRAFRANPNDAEVTGNLAFYYLKLRPAQPALARRLALYALAARGASSPAGRVEDWGTLAVASSLEGREADAVKAMYVMLTVSRNPERACRAAQLAVAQYGDPMKVPARAMLSRIRARGGIPNAPSCR